MLSVIVVAGVSALAPCGITSSMYGVTIKVPIVLPALASNEAGRLLATERDSGLILVRVTVPDLAVTVTPVTSHPPSEVAG